MKRIARSAIVGCTPQAFYEMVEDIESYPRFLPWCVATQVRERSPGRTVATVVIGVKALRYSFTTENANVPGESIDMRLVEGPFRHFAAQWRFAPLGEGACRAEFSLQYEFAGRAVAALLEPVLGRMADSTVAAFSRRAGAGS